MAKVVENNRETKNLMLSRRAYKLRQSGHDWSWIAKKLGIKEVNVRSLLA